MTTLAVDPGRYGAIAWRADGDVRWVVMPDSGSGVRVAEVVDLLRSTGAARMVIERAQSMPRQGVASTFRYGREYGVLLGVALALGVEVVEVPPMSWRRTLGVARAAGDADPKVAVRRVVELRCPTLQLPRSARARDGVVDAVGILLADEKQRSGG